MILGICENFLLHTTGSVAVLVKGFQAEKIYLNREKSKGKFSDIFS